MSAQTTILLVSAVYLLACVVIGILPGRKASDSATGYVAGDRTLGLFVMYFITGATIFSAFAFLGAPGWALSRGSAVFYILAYGTLGFVPFYFLGPRAARLGARFGFVTQGEMVAARFSSPALAGVMALVSLLGFVPYLALQIDGAGYVLNSMTDGELPVWAGGAIVYGVVLLYVLKSGVLGVGWTNTFQGLFMMGLAWFLGLYVPYKMYGGVGAMFDQIAQQRPEMLASPGRNSDGGPWTWTEYNSAVVLSIIGFSIWPHLFMKAFSARDERTLRRTVVLYPTFQLFLVPILLIGFAGILSVSQPASPDQILPHLLLELKLPALTVGLFCAGALAASMSSGDAMVHATASIVVRDGLVTALGKRPDPHAERRWIRWAVVGVMLAAYATAVLYQGSIVNLLLMAYGPIVQFAPGVYATLYARRATGAGVMSGLLVGIALNVLFGIYPDWRPLPVAAGLYGLGANVLVLIGVSFLGRAQTKGDCPYLAVAARPLEGPDR